jgi:hypothetical protein
MAEPLCSSDTDKTLKWFADACHVAGPTGCALYSSTADEVFLRVQALLTSLKTRPIAVLPPAESTATLVDPSSYGIIDYGTVRGFLFSWLYKPLSAGLPAKKLASMLAALELGDGAPLWEVLKAGQPTFSCECPAKERIANLMDANSAIACGDGDVVEDSLKELQEHYERMDREFGSWADLLAIGRVRCS